MTRHARRGAPLLAAAMAVALGSCGAPGEDGGPDSGAPRLGGPNLANHKTASASSSAGASLGAFMAVDGIDSTQWSSASADPQWILVDLGGTYTLNRVKVTWDARAYAKAFQVQVSTDGATFVDLYSATSNTSLVNDLNGLRPEPGRYLRILGTARATSFGYSIDELEAYGELRGCAPTTCAAQKKTCGTISDGCGGSLACGSCTAPQTCGGGGAPNVCGGRGPADTTPPVVKLTAPAPGASITFAQSIRLSANAADDVGVTQVEYFDGPTLLATASSPPFEASWSLDASKNGPHSITARARDAAGNMATSAATSISVAIPYCGDRVCSAGEACGSCPADCGACPVRDLVLASVSDVHAGKSGSQAQVAALVKSWNPDYVIMAGDLTYNGTPSEFSTFHGWFGSLKDKILPSPGNHEYYTSKAPNYGTYFGPRVGAKGAYWYSVDLPNGWHVVSLDGNLDVGEGSAQYEWLDADLKAAAGRHILAVWHQPRWSSDAEHGSDATYAPLMKRLVETGAAELVINGHCHSYQRYTRMGDSGADAKGPVELISATGGYSWKSWGAEPSTELYRQNTDFGALKLTLRESSWEYAFVSLSGKTMDSGTVACMSH